MFNNKRFLTARIDSEIPLSLQCFLWNLIDTMLVSCKDYLQVFKITSKDNKLKIVHSQECPDYTKSYIIENCFSFPVNIKIFVIDSNDYSTMLFADEY